MPSASNNRAQRLQESRGLRAKAPVAAQFEDCLQATLRLVDALQANRPDSDHLRNLADACKDGLRSWGDDSGASSRSLDYALKHSPLVIRQIDHLLTDLDLVLGQAVAGVGPDEPEAEDTPETSIHELPAAVDAAKYDDAAQEDQDPESRPETCLEEALGIVGCLVKLLPILRDPLVEEEEEQRPNNTDNYALDWHIRLAAELFPEASATLHGRLGNANWRRRRHLRQLRDKLKANGDGTTSEQAVAPRQAPREQSRRRRGGVLAKQRRLRESTRANSDRSSVLTSDASETVTILSRPETVLSSTPYSDHNSATSVADSQHPSIVPRLIPPDPPVNLDEQDQFPCPYCHFELPLTVSSHGMTEDEWISHVYLDLKPYMCTWDTCNRDNRTFGTKSQWFRHELDFHRSQVVWSCGICRADFEAEAVFLAHLRTTHGNIAPRKLGAMLDSCKRYSHTLASSKTCTLCGMVCSTMVELENHLGSHLEIFALAVISGHDISEDEYDASDGYGIDDYIDEVNQELFGAPGFEAPTTLVKTVRAASTTRTGDADPEHGDTSANSNLDDLDKEARMQKNVPWTEKVTTFLERQSVQGPGATPTTRSNIPSKSGNFVGRHSDMTVLHDHLAKPGQICNISGPGGIGKTAISVEYIHRYDSEYWYIFWVEAESPGTCQEKYNLISESFDLGQKPLRDENGRTFVVRECLGRTERRWLLVFDNVANWADIARYVPKNLSRTKGSVIITSRSGPLLSAVPTWAQQHSLPLEPWSLEESREFLLTSIDSRLSRDHLGSHEEFHLAKNVVEVVGHLPLAISVISGYIKVSRCTLADFLDMWEERESRKRNRKRKKTVPDTDVNPTVDSIWDIGIREIRTNCRKLLDVMSFLDPETVQKSLLVADHKEDYLDFLHEDEVIRQGSHASNKRMIQQLEQRSLISVKELASGEEAYSIHRTLQQKIQDDMDDYSFADAFRKAFRMIRKRFPKADPAQVPDPKNMDLCKENMPHVFTLWRIFNEHHTMAPMAEPTQLEIAELLYDAGFYVWSAQTTVYDGLSFLTTAERILDEIPLNPDARLRADIHCMIGLLQLNMGCVERKKATQRLQKAWKIRQTIYPSQANLETDTLLQNAANDYCLCLLNDYKFKDAGKILRSCHKQYLKWGPESENPFENSKFYGNISIVLLWEGEEEGAILSQRRSISYTEKFAGKKSQYYRRQFLLACILLQTGDVHASLQKHLETLNARLELHGKHHDFTISSLFAVGSAYAHTGDFDAAIEYMRDCVSIGRSSRWSAEPLARAKYHLATLYERTGVEEEEARKLKEEARKVLDLYKHYASRAILESGDEAMIFDDMQPTFQGRYTGRRLLKYMQAWSKSGGQPKPPASGEAEGNDTDALF